MAGNRRLAVIVMVVSAAMLLGCLPCFSASRRGGTPVPTVAISEDAAGRFSSKIEGPVGKDFRLEFTEQEVTSYVALRLADVVPLASPQIRFQPGRILLEGDLTRPIRTHVTLAATVSIVDGRPELQFQDAAIAGATVPRFLLASISDSLSESIGAGQEAVEIQQVEVLAGRIVVSGRMHQP